MQIVSKRIKCCISTLLEQPDHSSSSHQTDQQQYPVSHYPPTNYHYHYSTPFNSQMGSNDKPPSLRVWLSWSSGKDCAFTLYTLRQRQDVQVVGLLTTVNERFDRVAMHAVRCQLLRQQAEAVGLPVHEIKLPFPCSNEDYEQRMAGAIKAAQEAGIDAIAYGDLFLKDVREYRERMMAPTGIATMFPIWLPGSDKTTAQLAKEMMAAGFKAVLACLDPKKLPASLAGRVWDEQLLAELPEGVDPCGENGEFHSFVFDGPIFTQPVEIKVGRAIERDGFVYCDVLPSDYDDAAAEAEAAAADQARQELAQHKPEEVDCLELLKASNPPCPIKPSAEKQ